MSPFFFLILKLSVAETNCETLRGAKAYELVSLSYEDIAESGESCTTLLYIHLHYVLHYSIFYDQCALSCAIL